MTIITPRDAVRDLAGRYADALNRWDTDALGDCFTAGGVWDVVGIARGEGREDIVHVMSEARNRFDWLYQLLHNILFIDCDESTARARAYATEMAHLDGKALYMCWMYNDECVVGDDGVWRFARRTIDNLYYGPPDLSATPRRYPAPTR